MITISGAVVLVIVLSSFILGFFLCALMTMSKISDHPGVKQ